MYILVVIFLQSIFLIINFPSLRLWSDPLDDHETEIVPKEVFSRMSSYRNRLIQLGLKPEPIFPKFCAQNQNECV